MQKTEAHLTIECERAVEEERVRADEIEEQRTVAELQNELLTEMVAAEQVNVGTVLQLVLPRGKINCCHISCAAFP